MLNAGLELWVMLLLGLTVKEIDDGIYPPTEHSTHPFTTIPWKQSFVSQASCIIFDWSCHPGVLKPDPMSPSCPRVLNLQEDIEVVCSLY